MSKNNQEIPKIKKHKNISIEFYGQETKDFFVIVFTSYDEFLSHRIYDKAKTKKEGIKKAKSIFKEKPLANGANIYLFQEVFNMYKWFDNVLDGFTEDGLQTWIEKENEMLNKFEFRVFKS